MAPDKFPIEVNKTKELLDMLTVACIGQPEGYPQRLLLSSHSPLWCEFVENLGILQNSAVLNSNAIWLSEMNAGTKAPVPVIGHSISGPGEAERWAGS